MSINFFNNFLNNINIKQTRHMHAWFIQNLSISAKTLIFHEQLTSWLVVPAQQIKLTMSALLFQ